MANCQCNGKMPMTGYDASRVRLVCQHSVHEGVKSLSTETKQQSEAVLGITFSVESESEVRIGVRPIVSEIDCLTG